MIQKAVIPVAGSGTRLLPATKEQPKEMLPVFSFGTDGMLCMKPLVQLVFEKLYDNGLREFCFIVGRGKRSIEDHFTLDLALLHYLRRKRKFAIAEGLNRFYKRVSDCQIVFVNQPEPVGLGNAVLQARSFTGDDAFMVHAGDDFVLSRDDGYLKRLEEVFQRYEADAALCLKKVKDPTKYGIVEGEKICENVYKVTGIKEKPARSASKLGVIAIYLFRESIYRFIRRTKPDAAGEIQLTDAIAHLIGNGGRAYGVELRADETRIDIGTPGSYWLALKETRRLGHRGHQLSMKTV